MTEEIRLKEGVCETANKRFPLFEFIQRQPS
jgi:hypothetical protein